MKPPPPSAVRFRTGGGGRRCAWGRLLLVVLFVPALLVLAGQLGAFSGTASADLGVRDGRPLKRAEHSSAARPEAPSK